jgi:N-acetylmuramoyl-L-alanine amidase
LRWSLLFFVVLLGFLATPATGLARNAGYAYEQASSFAQDVRNDARKRLLRHYWLRAIERLADVAQKYPNSPEAAKAQFMVGKLYAEMSEVSRISDDVDSAIEAYRKMVRSYPNDRLADDAQFEIGKLFLERHADRTGAYGEFERVVTLFPRGDMAARARNMLTLLSDAKPAPTLARKQLVNVNRVLHWSNPDSTRIAIYVGEKTTFKYGFLAEDDKAKRPSRIYIDVQNARLDPVLRQPIPIADGLLKQARAGQFTADSVRIVLDLESIGDFKVFALVSPFRIVVDVYSAASQQVAAPVIPAPPRRPSDDKEPTIRSLTKDSAAVSMSSQLGLQIRRIVIDPGHGGHDPGAVGVGKVYEKNIALAISRQVAAELRKQLNVEVILTRDDDTFIQLEGRPGIARAKRGDLFISIHANSAANPRAVGIETYHLDFTNNREAIAVAARENASSEASVSEQEEILRDLVLTSKKNDSIQLARAVQSSMIGGLGKRYDGVRDLGVKGAPFVVLIGANVPAILIETGFISHPLEVKRLQDRRYTQHMAESIAAGVGEYIKGMRNVTF